jgi:hypothetical protein
VGLPHCQYIAALLLFSSTVNFAPSVYKTEWSKVFVLLGKMYLKESWCRRGIIETYKNCVGCEVISEGNYNGKYM